MSKLVVSDQTALTPAVDNFSIGLARYLRTLGLPHAGVLVDMAERVKVINNLPGVVDEIPAARKPLSLYVSKFIASCLAGLFDAVLNYL